MLDVQIDTEFSYEKNFWTFYNLYLLSHLLQIKSASKKKNERIGDCQSRNFTHSKWDQVDRYRIFSYKITSV